MRKITITAYTIREKKPQSGTVILAFDGAWTICEYDEEDRAIDPISGDMIKFTRWAYLSDLNKTRKAK